MENFQTIWLSIDVIVHRKYNLTIIFKTIGEPAEWSVLSYIILKIMKEVGEISWRLPYHKIKVINTKM